MNTYTAPFRNPLISDNAVTYFPEASKLFTSVTSVAILTSGSRDKRIFTKFTPCSSSRSSCRILVNRAGIQCLFSKFMPLKWNKKVRYCVNNVFVVSSIELCSTYCRLMNKCNEMRGSKLGCERRFGFCMSQCHSHSGSYPYMPDVCRMDCPSVVVPVLLDC